MIKLIAICLTMLFSLANISENNYNFQNGEKLTYNQVDVVDNDEYTEYSISCPLYTQSNARSTNVSESGCVLYKVVVYDDNRLGEILWTIHLNNGDRIKSVSGTFVIKRDIFGPINPTIVSMDVDKIYIGTLYTKASDVEFFDLGKSYKGTDNFIIQATGFIVYGLENTYSQRFNDELQGEIDDFRD